MPVFLYGDTETRYLRERDPLLGAAIDRIGPVCREVIPDLFEALVHAIVGAADRHQGSGCYLGQAERALWHSPPPICCCLWSRERCGSGAFPCEKSSIFGRPREKSRPESWISRL